MRCEQHLALEAILVGMRRSGAIDKRTVKNIIVALQETANRARPHCAESADSLDSLAEALTEGPARSCLISVAA